MKKNTAAAFFIVFLAYSCSKAPDFLPTSILSFKLTKKISGNEAKNYLNRLHYESVIDVESEIGFYEKTNGTAIIYISHYKNKDSTKNIFDSMTKKISDRNSLYSQSGFININGIKVYKTFSRGQTHFVFMLNTTLFWVSVDNESAENFIKDYLNNLD